MGVRGLGGCERGWVGVSGAGWVGVRGAEWV